MSVSVCSVYCNCLCLKWFSDGIGFCDWKAMGWCWINRGDMGDVVAQEKVTTWHNTTTEPEAASVQVALSPVAPRGYLKLIYGNPTVTGKTLEHGNEELETAGPVAD